MVKKEEKVSDNEKKFFKVIFDIESLLMKFCPKIYFADRTPTVIVNIQSRDICQYDQVCRESLTSMCVCACRFLCRGAQRAPAEVCG